MTRNRENKLLDTFKNFKFVCINYPVFVRGYIEYCDFKKQYDELGKKFDVWKEKMENDIQEFRLPADIVFSKIYKKATFYPSNEYLDRAKTRKFLGNPPGKGDSLGDSINWECLLDKVPIGDDLYFISGDSDYQSILDEKQFHPFLIKEWKTVKNSNLYYYNSIKSFLNENVKEVNINYENEKNELIDKLSRSSSYSKTHEIIAQLNNFEGWNREQIEKLVNILESNSQVGGIMNDDDVDTFYKSLFNK